MDCSSVCGIGVHVPGGRGFARNMKLNTSSVRSSGLMPEGEVGPDKLSTLSRKNRERGRERE